MEEHNGTSKNAAKRIIQRILTDDESDNASDDSDPPLSDVETMLSDNSTHLATGTPSSATPIMSGDLSDSSTIQTSGSSFSNSLQLVGHTPMQKKKPNSKHIEYSHNESPAAGEVTLDAVHKSLREMIGSVLERLGSTEQRISSLEQKIKSILEQMLPNKNKSSLVIDKAVGVSVRLLASLKSILLCLFLFIDAD